MVKSLESAAAIKLYVLVVFRSAVDTRGLLCHFRGPDCAYTVASAIHVGVQGRNVIYQSQVDSREPWPIIAVTDSELRDGWFSCEAPVVQHMLQVWRGQQIRWTRTLRWFISSMGHVHIVTPYRVLGAILALRKFF